MSRTSTNEHGHNRPEDEHPRLSSAGRRHDARRELGELVHDFRNVLNTLHLLSEVAGASLPKESRAVTTLRQIQAACIHTSEMCERLLAESGHAPAEAHGPDRLDLKWMASDLSAHVRDMVPLLNSSVPATSELQFDLAADLPAIEISPGDMRRVVLNLVVNAAQAIGDQRGAVTVTTGQVRLDAAALRDALFAEDMHPGLYVCLIVSDTGCGMDQETRDHLFERHYTTKPDGHGLGMASIRRIVAEHHAALQVESRVGIGTTVRVLFPAAAAVPVILYETAEIR
ncbi:MAG: hypothetical protein KY476_16175 [Planctomycetes bacterium]|nr:hypothetical protein [Planctomycetota bacterium]